MALAIDGDCLAGVAQLRAHPQVFGPVASEPTVSPPVDALAAALAALNAVRAATRSTAWALAGVHGSSVSRSPNAG